MDQLQSKIWAPLGRISLDLQSLADIGAITEQYRAEAWKSLQRRCSEYLQAHESHRINIPALRPSSPALIDVQGPEDNHERIDWNAPSIQTSDGPRPGVVSGKYHAGFDLDAFEKEAAMEWGDISTDNRLANGTPRRTSQPATGVVAARPRVRHAWSEGSLSDHPDTEDDDVGVVPSPLSPATAVAQVDANDNMAGQNGPKDKKVKKRSKKPDRQSTERQEPNQLELAIEHEKEHLHLSTDKQLSDSLKPTEHAQRLFAERGSSEELVVFGGRQQQQVRQTQMHIQQPKSSPNGSAHTTNTQPPARPVQEKSKKPTQIICPFWVTYGKGACALKAHCPFLHEAVPGLPQEMLECWFLRTRGRCIRQASCKFAHHETAHGVWASRPGSHQFRC